MWVEMLGKIKEMLGKRKEFLIDWDILKLKRAIFGSFWEHKMAEISHSSKYVEQRNEK